MWAVINFGQHSNGGWGSGEEDLQRGEKQRWGRGWEGWPGTCDTGLAMAECREGGYWRGKGELREHRC